MIQSPERPRAEGTAACPWCAGGTRRAVELSLPGKGRFQVRRCRACRLEFVQPLMAEQDLARGYDAGYYEAGYLVPELERRRRTQFRGLLAELGRRGASGPLLDMGCGVGFLVAEARAAGWEAAGMEPSPAARRLARERLGIEIGAADISDVPAERPFGTIVLWHVLAHAADPLARLRDAASRLRPGGTLAMSFVNWDDPRYRFAALEAKWRGLNTLHVPTIQWRFRESHLRQLAARAGLAVEAVEQSPRPASPAVGWKRTLLESGFASMRRLTGVREELIAWCRKP